jgi:hypothetical protein
LDLDVKIEGAKLRAVKKREKFLEGITLAQVSAKERPDPIGFECELEDVPVDAYGTRIGVPDYAQHVPATLVKRTPAGTPFRGTLIDP